MAPINDPTPRARTNNAVRITGTIVVALLVISVLLLALGVFNFEQLGWFK